LPVLLSVKDRLMLGIFKLSYCVSNLFWIILLKKTNNQVFLTMAKSTHTPPDSLAE